MRQIATITCVCFWLSACGSSDDAGASCKTTAACGGDVLGTWKLSDACYIVLQQPMLDFCEKASADLQVEDTDGTLIFDKDTFSLKVELSSHVNLHLPASCRQDQGKMLACSDFDGMTDDGHELSCSTSANGDCTCAFPFPVKLDQSGIYAVRGKQLEWGAEKTDYCVSGKRLVLQPGMQLQMGGMKIDASFLLQTTFEKQ